VFFDYWK